MEPVEITVREHPVTGVWTFEFRGCEVEVEPRHEYVQIDGHLYESTAVAGLKRVEDLAGEPLAAISRLIDAGTDATRRPGQAANEQATPRADRAPVEQPAKPTRKRRSKSRKPPQPPTGVEGTFPTPDAALYLGLSPATLETMRSRGGGPQFVKLGRRVVYRREDLDVWLAARVRKSTSDPGEE